MQIKLSQIPRWLHKSVLYKNLRVTTINGKIYDEEIFVPDLYSKFDRNINNIKDFIDIFNTCRYWMADYPASFYKWGREHKKETRIFLKASFLDRGDMYQEEIDELFFEMDLE